MEHTDTGALGLGGRTRTISPSVQLHLPLVVRVNAAEDFDQRRLTRAILPRQPVNTSSLKRERNRGERLNASKALANPLEPQQRR